MSNLYNKYIDNQKIDTTRIYNYDVFMKMFNGLNEIGGETVKYKNIPSCLPTDVEDQIKMEICCIVVFSKPSGVVFAGLTSEEKRIRLEESGYEVEPVDDKAAKEKQIVDIEAYMANNEMDNVVKEAMENRLNRHKSELADLLAEEVMNNIGGQNEDLGATDGQVSQEGNTVDSVGLESVCFDERLAQWLPKLSASELKNQTKEARAASVKARFFWKNEFKDVNMSKVKRIALLSLQLRKQNTPQALQWKKNHKGKPTQAVPRMKESEETKKIFIETMNDFKACKKEWSTKEMREAFNRKV